MSFRPDQPIQSGKEDILGRQAFSQTLASAICSYQDKNSIVVGLYGSWGSGKTSIINMSLEHIGLITQNKPKKECPIVVKFNPWNYSDQNQLISQFFKQLSLALKKGEAKKTASKIGKYLEAYAAFFEPALSIVHPVAGSAARGIQKMGSAIQKRTEIDPNDLASIKVKLNNLLEKRKNRIILVIDDIDRLNNVEIRQIFQLIKSLGDFPNTIYLLAFDKNVVINALKKVQEGPGEEYLEKIVQIPFEVPLADKQEIKRLLFSQLDQLIRDIPETQWDKVYWGNIYHSGLKHFFENIRDVTRYINSLRLSFEMVKGEVNAIDFLAIMGLQVFLPDVYARIRDSKEIFAGASRDRESQAQRDEERKRCDDVLNKVGDADQEQLKDLLKRLFPRLESFYGNTNYSSDWLDNWRKAGRVCSPDIFEVFFRLSIPKSEISQKDILRILATANNLESFSKELIALNKQGKIARFLDRFEDYTSKDIPPDNFKNIITALIDLGDMFPEGETGFFSFDTPLRILRITHQLLRRVDDRAERFNILKSAFDGAEKSLFIVVHEVGVQDQEHGKYNLKDKPRPEEDFTLPSEYLDQLEKLACEKIKAWAQDGRLAKHKKLAGILYRWENWANKSEVDAFIAEMIQSDDGLVNFISSFLGKSTSHGMSDYVGKVHWRIDLDRVKHFVEPESIKDRVSKIVQSTDFNQFSEDNQKAVGIFLDTIDGKIKKSDWE